MLDIALKTHVTQACRQETLPFDVAGKLCSIVDNLDKFCVPKSDVKEEIELRLYLLPFS
jgi:hypothetical protein